MTMKHLRKTLGSSYRLATEFSVVYGWCGWFSAMVSDGLKQERLNSTGQLSWNHQNNLGKALIYDHCFARTNQGVVLFTL